MSTKPPSRRTHTQYFPSYTSSSLHIKYATRSKEKQPILYHDANEQTTAERFAYIKVCVCVCAAGSMFIVKDKNHDLPKSSDETSTHINNDAQSERERNTHILHRHKRDEKRENYNVRLPHDDTI